MSLVGADVGARGVFSADGDGWRFAVLFALQRRAAGEGKALRFAALPTALCELTKVYGIEDLIAS